MATTIISLANLQRFFDNEETRVGNLLSAVDAKSIKCGTVVSDTLYLFKTDTIPMSGGAVDTSKAAVTVALTNSEVTQLRADVDAINNTTTGILAQAKSYTDGEIDKLGTAASADVATAEISEESTDTGLVSAAQVAKFVKDEVADLEGATHFIGKKDSLPTTANDGDICIVGVKEYIWGDGKWNELGDESIYVAKTTTIAGVDLENDITKAEMLTALNVADGAQVNVLEGVQVNGANLTVDSNKKVNVTVAQGSTNGTIAVNGVDVSVKGLGSAAYTDASAYDVSGAADTAETNAKAYADGLYAIATEAQIDAMFDDE